MYFFISRKQNAAIKLAKICCRRNEFTLNCAKYIDYYAEQNMFMVNLAITRACSARVRHAEKQTRYVA